MRDVVVLVFLAAAIIASLRQAWYGVLALAVFSYLNPHTYAWGFTRTLPVYLIVFLVAFASFLASKDRQPLPRDWRIPVFFILWGYFFLTTLFAKVPEAAHFKLKTVSKIYAPFLLTLILINTKEKLYYLIITIAASFGIPAAKGGIWAIGTGFNFRVYGPPATQFTENNAFAIAVLMNIPLLILWLRQTKNRWIKWGLMLVIPLSVASALSSWSRGALLTLGVLLLVLIWHSKRKYLAIPLVVLGAYMAVDFLPQEWFGRMHTVETYEQDESAQGRLQAWRDGINYALDHPLVGSGFEGWRYVTMRDWHSSYVEMLAEHGFIAFTLWISLLFGSILSLTRLPKRTRGVPGMEWVANWSYMLRASLIAYATGTIFLGLSYWDIMYHIVFISVLLKKFSLEELEQRRRRDIAHAPTAIATQRQINSPAPATDLPPS